MPDSREALVEGLSVVIPVFNSAGILPELMRRLSPVLAGTGGPFEAILVNDGSHDTSWDAICRLVSEYPWARGLDLMRNFGQHNALLCGIREARYATIVTMDDDLQHPPEEIPLLLQRLQEGCAVVYGYPAVAQHSLMRNLTSALAKAALQGAMGIETARQVSAFRAFRTEIRDAFADYRSPYVSIDVLLTWGTTRFAAIPVRHDPRHSGVSNYTWRKLLTHAINLTTGFSTWPLQLASLIGFAFTLFGMAVLGYVLIRYLIGGGVVPGFAFLASIIAVFSGAILFALGIMGEYLARMHLRSMGRPHAVIREATPPTKSLRKELLSHEQ